MCKDSYVAGLAPLYRRQTPIDFLAFFVEHSLDPPSIPHNEKHLNLVAFFEGPQRLFTSFLQFRSSPFLSTYASDRMAVGWWLFSYVAVIPFCERIVFAQAMKIPTQKIQSINLDPKDCAWSIVRLSNLLLLLVLRSTTLVTAIPNSHQI